jgi:putative oxidoreductase
MRGLFRFYDRLTPLFTWGQAAFLLFIRLYWGWQLATNGWAKLHHLDKVTEYFESINVPMPHMTAGMVGLLELTSGVLLFIGLASRLISIPLTVNLIAAYWFGDHEALLSFFSDPGKFYAADPFTFLFIAVIVLLFGPGLFSLDALIRKYSRREATSPTHTMAA